MKPLPGPHLRCALWSTALVLWMFVAVWCGDVQAQSSEKAAVSARQAIETVEEKTGYRFLYRDAAVAGVDVDRQVASAAGPGEALNRLEAALREHGLALRVDDARGQVLVLSAKQAGAREVLRGTVVDAASGMRLPLATVLWADASTGSSQPIGGTATGNDGRFRMAVGALPQEIDTLAVRVSYVGYRPQTVYVPLHPPPAAVPIRLVPEETQAPELLVSSAVLQARLDTTWTGLIRAGRYAPLGESSAMRALQPLPSVWTTAALSGGLVVRGTPPDGFDVRLDGAPIYNHSHLFGMFDAFNAEALQTVALYYGVAPATLQAPPGGTLSFRTRGGSQSRTGVTLRASTTAVSGTVEGPIAGGRGSYLVSARRSYLGALDWAGNADLVAQGLDVDRRREPLPPNAVRAVGERVTESLEPDASFYDVHGKTTWEGEDGRRVAFSVYTGGDDAAQRTQQLERDPGARSGLRIDTVSTEHRWGNVSASLRADQPVNERAFVDATVAFTRYYSRYGKDAFVYSRRRADGSTGFFVAPFSSQNDLWQGLIEPRVEWLVGTDATVALGSMASFIDVAYAEESPLRNPVDIDLQTVQVDAYAQVDAASGPVDLALGTRVHYYDAGRFVRVSPRLRVEVGRDERPVSVFAGYARNHQFLHRLDVVGETSSSVWVPSTAEQPPGRVDHLTGGLEWRLPDGRLPGRVVARLEGYVKEHDNLRLHETVTRLRPGATSVLFAPWSVRNRSTARGLETLLRHTAGPVTTTVGHAWSRVDVTVPGSGERPADWDRRHQLTGRVDASLSASVSASLTGTYATGTPNPYARFRADEPERLGSTARLDASLRVQRRVGGMHLDARAAVYNVTNRNNPWYRTPVAVWTRPNGPQSRPQASFALLDVYDLGIQPALSVAVTW